jgi:membrane protein implicated in regulation of membrane protease activity
MNRMQPQTLLFILLGTVPLVVAGAGVAAFLLMRAGYGVLVWAVVPFLVSLLIVAALAFVLSRGARASRGQDERESSDGQRRGRDGV